VTEKQTKTNKKHHSLFRLQPARDQRSPPYLAWWQRKSVPLLHPLTFLIRSVVSPLGAIENLWENAPTAGKCLYLGCLSLESDQAINVKTTYRRVQMLRISLKILQTIRPWGTNFWPKFEILTVLGAVFLRQRVAPIFGPLSKNNTGMAGLPVITVKWLRWYRPTVCVDRETSEPEITGLTQDMTLWLTVPDFCCSVFIPNVMLYRRPLYTSHNGRHTHEWNVHHIKTINNRLQFRITMFCNLADCILWVFCIKIVPRCCCSICFKRVVGLRAAHNPAEVWWTLLLSRGTKGVEHSSYGHSGLNGWDVVQATSQNIFVSAGVHCTVNL